MSRTSISFYQRGILKRIGELTDEVGHSFSYGNSRTRDALIRKGFIKERASAYGTYVITDAGRIALEPVIKTCSCKREYTKTSWKLLDFVSFYDDNAPAIPEHPEFGEPKGRCEMRNCVCGSSIIVPLTTLEEKAEAKT